MKTCVVERIVSGGQTGVDRAALNWAMAHGVPHGGWCPRGRLSEDGPIPSIYALRETQSGEYRVRTEWNVRDSDATLIIAPTRPLKGGTALTRRIAERLERPVMVLGPEDDPGELRAWVDGGAIRVLNVAGPRESGARGVAALVHRILDVLRIA